MRRGWLICAGMATAVPLASGLNRSSRHFVPQAVVVAKKKLSEISQGPHRTRRRDLLDTLETLFVDFGLPNARNAAHNVVVGEYEFFRALSRDDRSALAPVVADLTKLFPEETGMVALLKARMSTLSKLQDDDDPTVAKRARWLVELANGKSGDVASKSELTATLRSFLRLGRAGLVAYRNISDAEIVQVRDRLPELERLATSDNDVIAKQAKMIIQLAARYEVAGVSEQVAKTAIRRFLAKGTVAPARTLRVSGGEEDGVLATRLFEKLPELEAFTHDQDPIVVERAQTLIRIAHGQPVAYAAGTVEFMARSFLAEGRSGLVDYQGLSAAGVARLFERLPELKRLAQDSNPRVARGARVLIQVANKEKEKDIGLQKNALSRYMNAFLNRGRDGLLYDDYVSDVQIEQLKKRRPELEALAQDSDRMVARQATSLLQVANGDAASIGHSALGSIVLAFLRGGREGLKNHDGLIKTLQDQLVEQFSTLVELSQDKNAVLSARAEALIQFAAGEELPDYSVKQLTRLARYFKRGGRAGLLGGNEISQKRIRQLVDRLPELENLARDDDPILADQARALVHLAKKEEVPGYALSRLRRMTDAFLAKGRAGLLEKTLVRIWMKRHQQGADELFSEASP